MSRPFAARNDVTFTLQERDGATDVTWAVEGPAHFVSKLMGVFIDMDKMCGDQFEKGLKDLKIVAERETPALSDGSRTAAA